MELWENSIHLRRYHVDEQGNSPDTPFDQDDFEIFYEVHCANDCADVGFQYNNETGLVEPE